MASNLQLRRAPETTGCPIVLVRRLIRQSMTSRPLQPLMEGIGQRGPTAEDPFETSMASMETRISKIFRLENYICDDGLGKC
jgi:hypothetical protein